MEQLLKIESGAQLSSGIFPAQTGESPLVWADGRNVEFESGKVRKTKGKIGLSNLSARPRGMKAAFAETERRLYIGAGGDFYRYRSSDGLTNIGSMVATGGTYVFVPWGTWVIASNGVNVPKIWKNSGSAAALTVPFTFCNTMFKYNGQVFAAGTSNGGNYVESSDFDDPEDWTSTLLNGVFTDALRDLDSDIISSHPLGSNIALYTRGEMGLFSYVGGTLVYAFRRQLTIGALTHYSVVPVGNLHYGLMKDLVYRTDGVSFQGLEDPSKRPITTWLRENVNWDRQSEIYGWHDRLNSQVRWIVPIGASAFLTIAYRYESGTWTIYNDSTVCGEESGVWDNAFVGKADRLLRLDTADPDDDDAAIDAYVYSKPVDFGNRDVFKRYGRIDLDIEWTGDVTISLAFMDNPLDTPTWVEYDIARQIYPNRESVFLAIKISSDSVGAEWELGGIEVWGEVMGYVG